MWKAQGESTSERVDVMANSPRRLRITNEADVLTEEHRKIHGTRVTGVANEAVQAATNVLREHLVDNEISVSVDSRVEWSYAWFDQETKTTMTAHDDGEV